MSRFHPLTVTDVRRDTRDAVVVTFAPADEDREAFCYLQGQHLTLRREFDGEELRRSYSICSGADDNVLRVGIKRVDGGVFSSWANDELKPGMVIEAMPPTGHFHVPLDPDSRRNWLGFAAGSGITPILSHIKTVLTREPQSRFTLVYANHAVPTIMFREELEDLKNLYLGRFSVLHILNSEAQDIDLFTGRLDAAKLDALFKTWINPANIDMALICGPKPLMEVIAQSLRDHGMPDEHVKYELFASGQHGRAKQPSPSRAAIEAGETVQATVTLDGTTRTFHMPKSGTTLLDAALDADLDVPFACKAGVCSTCMARVIEGEAEMLSNNALEDHEVRDGYILTCQCLPLSEKLVVTYDV